MRPSPAKHDPKVLEADEIPTLCDYTGFNSIETWCDHLLYSAPHKQLMCRHDKPQSRCKTEGHKLYPKPVYSQVKVRQGKARQKVV